MKRLICATSLATLFLAAGGGPAAAHTRTYRAQVTIQSVPSGAGTAQGVVTSPRDECKINRTVTLFKDGFVFATDQTDGTGTWQITSTFPSGSYVATIDNFTFKGNRKHRHRCAADNSDALNN